MNFGNNSPGKLYTKKTMNQLQRGVKLKQGKDVNSQSKDEMALGIPAGARYKRSNYTIIGTTFRTKLFFINDVCYSNVLQSMLWSLPSHSKLIAPSFGFIRAGSNDSLQLYTDMDWRKTIGTHK